MTVHLLVLTLLFVIDINSKPCNMDHYYKSFNDCLFRKRENENIKSIILNIYKKFCHLQHQNILIQIYINVYRWKLKSIMRSSYLSLSILYLQAYSTKVKKKKKIYNNVRYNIHINKTQGLIGKKHRLCNYTSVFNLQCYIHFRCFSTIIICDFIYKLDRFEISRQVACA